MAKTTKMNMTIVADACVDYIKKFLEKNEELLAKFEEEQDVFKSLFTSEKQTKVKRNCSAYNFFCKEQRSRLKEENPDATEADIKAQISSLWKAAKDDEDELSKFKQQAEEDKKRYEAEKEASGDNDKKKKKLKDKNKPKKSLSSYFIWGMDERAKIKAEHPELKATEIGVELGRRWATVKSDAKKMAKYNKAAEADKVRYQTEMASYTRPSDEELMASKKTKKSSVPKAKKGIKSKKTEEEPVPVEEEEPVPVEEEEPVPVEEEEPVPVEKPKKTRRQEVRSKKVETEKPKKKPRKSKKDVDVDEDDA
jgi:hypothetical protein